MRYKYDHDPATFGDLRFEAATYRLIQEGLQQLLAEIDKWNVNTALSGAQSPYEAERKYLADFVDWGNSQLGSSGQVVRALGFSVGTVRYIRAGLELILRRKRDELEKNRVAGWPSAVLASLGRSLEDVERVASELAVPPAEILWEVLPEREAGEIAVQMRTEPDAALWDAFVSHASEDKDAFVRPLVEALRGKGLRLWYDEFSLTIGDSLRRSIDKGLSRSRYGIVVLSPSFFAKEWPQRELDGLVAREINGEKVILPVWHNVDVAAVRRYSPTLADRVAAQSKDGTQEVVRQLLAVLKPA